MKARHIEEPIALDLLAIDRYALDIECAKHAKTFGEVSKEFIKSVSIRDRMKEQMDLVKAEVDAKVRQNPEEYIYGKGTEAEIAGIVLMSDEYRAAQHEYIQAREDVGVLQVAKDALEHKKTMLELLVKLYTSNYFSVPDLTQDEKVTVQQTAKRRQIAKLNGK
jgi:hypothetical protein